MVIRKAIIVPAVMFLLSFMAVSAFAQQTAPDHNGRIAIARRHVSRLIASGDAQIANHLLPEKPLTLAIMLPPNDPGGLNQLLADLYNPSNPMYHGFLSVNEFTNRFGPTAAQYQAVLDFATANGLKVTNVFRNRLVVDVEAPVRVIEKTFNVKLNRYTNLKDGSSFFGVDVEPTIDARYPVALWYIGGLTQLQVKSHLKFAEDNVRTFQTGSGPGGQFLGSDMRAAYYGGTALTGAGQSIGLYGLNFNLSDVQAYFSSLGQPFNPAVVQTISINGYDTSCGAGCDDGEPAIDIEQALSMAPGVNAVIEYEASNDVDTFNQMAVDNVAKQLSASIGYLPADPQSDEPIFQEFAAQGQNLFVASGDGGAYYGDPTSCQNFSNLNGCIFYPADDPFITAVGGTDMTTNGSGGSWLSETAWIGSGGGTSTNGFAIPSYQQLPGVISASNQGSTTLRNIPDVSAEANTDNYWCGNGSCQGGVGGTSLAAPRWAGFLALVNQQAALNNQTSIGFLNPTIYAIGTGANYNTDFHDITAGNDFNSGSPNLFSAVAGYDLATGWGSPNGQALINVLQPASLSPYFAMSASPSTLNLAPGSSATSTIQITSGNGFSGSITLAATILGAPAGLTASFSPQSITGAGSSVLTVTAASSAPGGNLILVVTGTSTTGALVQPAYITLALPDFSISSTATSIYLNQGTTASSTISITPQNGFSSSVALSVTGGLPNGVMESLTPANTQTGGTLTLTASHMATTGVGNALSISGTAGGITQSAPPIAVAVSAATGTGGSGTPVDLSSAYNLNSFYTDGTNFTASTSMDGVGFAYSATVLTPNRILNDVQFNFGPANQLNAISSAGQTIALPAGHFTALQLLGTGINGNQAAQPITISYADGSSTQVMQGFSDWFSPSNNAAEFEAVAMPYRDIANGGQDNRQFNLYAYTIVLDRNKKVQSVTLPNNGNVVVLAATLIKQSLGISLDLSSKFNVAGVYANGVTFPATGGMDGGGDGCTLASGCADAYSSQQMGLSSTAVPTVGANGLLFDFGPVNEVNCTTGCLPDEINISPGVTIPLHDDQRARYSLLNILGTAVNGSHTGTITVNYERGAPDIFNQTFSDWCGFSSNSNESIAVGAFSRINSDGTLNTGAPCNLYLYSYTLDSNRRVKSIALANTDGSGDVFIFAINLTEPRYALSAGVAVPSSIQPGNSSSVVVTVSPELGYSGIVRLSCEVLLPSWAEGAPQCSVAPVHLPVSGGPANATVTFTTAKSRPDCDGDRDGDRNDQRCHSIQGTPAGTYTILINGEDSNGMRPGGAPALVTVSVQ